MTNEKIEFGELFEALTDHWPMRWQLRLFKEVDSGEIRAACDLPTGLGKTSVIAVWLIALASQAGRGKVTLPRRLVYIVNRRTVVDQATDVVERIRERLVEPEGAAWRRHAVPLQSLGTRLCSLTATDALPLAISTLRGERADNEQWKIDPARAAIIVGTIDMIGSKLLFSGYGDGSYKRPHHAGLIGQDSLIVHDEAHLAPAFGELLRNVAETQRDRDHRPARVLELSATTRDSAEDVFTLGPDDEQDEIVQQRLDAKKRLRLREIGKDDLAAKLAELARTHEASPSKVLVYVRSPDLAQKVVDALARKLGDDSDSRVALLTGTMRGRERDMLVRENLVYLALLNHDEPVQRTMYLVSTSAGEVGIDLDADHMVCDLTTLDSMIQRLGRVNRRGGECRIAEIDVVVQKHDADSIDNVIAQAVRLTRAVLSRLAPEAEGTHNASPRALRELLKGLDEDEKNKTFSPKPAVRPVTDILLDAWSLTSIMKPIPGRPAVAPYLHGLTHELPDIYLAWRLEVTSLNQAGADDKTLSAWFRACRIEAQEHLRERTDRVKKALRSLLTKHRKDDKKRDFPVVLLNERGEAESSWLSQIVDKQFSLSFRTVVLPVEVGGLAQPYGMLNERVTNPATDVAEVAEETTGVKRRVRGLLTGEDEGQWERLTTGETEAYPPAGLRELTRVTLRAPAEGEEDAETKYLVLMVNRQRLALERPEIAKIRQTLAKHTSRIESHAINVARALKLDLELEEVLVTAARWHDRGKARPIWQRFARNPTTSEPLAKSTEYLHGRALAGYRHEFGSLLDAHADEGLKRAFEERPESLDLILHLIAAHHDWARPHFERNAWDRTYTMKANQDAAAEVMRRFGRLQQRFGHWGLAWLESLLRCADIAASQQRADTRAVLQSTESQQ